MAARAEGLSGPQNRRRPRVVLRKKIKIPRKIVLATEFQLMGEPALRARYDKLQKPEKTRNLV
jgi:hypothetical protein